MSRNVSNLLEALNQILSIQITREENECQRKIHQQSGITLAINYKNKFRNDAHVIDLIWKPNKDFNLNI